MPRPHRLHVPAAHYHVTLRGNHRQNIFFCAADRQLFNEITAEVLDRFTARLHAFCWMTNHVHMLIQVGDTPLGRLMLRIAGRYARAVQKNLRTTGHLFEKRYHPILVDADAYLLAGRLLGAVWKPKSRSDSRKSSVKPAISSPSPWRHSNQPALNDISLKARAWIAHQSIAQKIASLSAVARRFHRTEAALRHSVKRHFNYP